MLYRAKQFIARANLKQNDYLRDLREEFKPRKIIRNKTYQNKKN